jgi:hypothetical protein
MQAFGQNGYKKKGIFSIKQTFVRGKQKLLTAKSSNKDFCSNLIEIKGKGLSFFAKVC